RTSIRHRDSRAFEEKRAGCEGGEDLDLAFSKYGSTADRMSASEIVAGRAGG
ncbi:unnamed protein product, partial [Ectocarpus sp. 13 AM-2016]